MLRLSMAEHILNGKTSNTEVRDIARARVLCNLFEQIAEFRYREFKRSKRDRDARIRELLASNSRNTIDVYTARSNENRTREALINSGLIQPKNQ